MFAWPAHLGSARAKYTVITRILSHALSRRPRLFLTVSLPSAALGVHMAKAHSLYTPENSQPALSQLERTSGCVATSLSAETHGPLPCQRCLCKGRVRCLGG